MALQVVGSLITGAFRGVRQNEVGFNCKTFKLELTPEVRDVLNGITGEGIGFAVSIIPMGKLTMEGEILSSNSGIIVATFIAPFVPVNNVTFYGRTGGFYLMTASIGQDREGWNDISAELESRPLIA